MLAPRCRLTSLAAFVGHVCRASPDMELTALLQYLVNQLRARESHDMVVLKELISTMTVRTGRQHLPMRSERAICAAFGVAGCYSSATATRCQPKQPLQCTAVPCVQAICSRTLVEVHVALRVVVAMPSSIVC